MIRKGADEDFEEIFNIINDKGIGTLLIRELIKDSTKPILVGTWKAAKWAISFYEKLYFCVNVKKHYS